MKRQKLSFIFIVLLTIVGNSFFNLPVEAEDIDISLYSNHSSDNASFNITNMFPGDSVTNKYNVKVSYHDKVSVLFNVDYLNEYSKLASVTNIKVKLINDDNDKVLYDGFVCDLKDNNLSYALESSNNKTEVLEYEITISLDTSVNNDYQNKELKLDFIWSIDKEETKNLIVPSTGYSSNIILWISLIIFSLIMIVFLYKRNNSNVR